MQNPPSIAALAERLETLLAEHVDFKRPLDPKAALSADLGFDSLDLIETSFSIQEYFDFEFSDKNALEELDLALGGGQLIQNGRLTDLGFELLRERMPELAERPLPETMTPAEVQKYFSLETFARLVREFLVAVPDTCPKTGASIVLLDMVPRTTTGDKPECLPSGDQLLAAWVEDQAARLRPN